VAGGERKDPVERLADDDVRVAVAVTSPIGATDKPNAARYWSPAAVRSGASEMPPADLSGRPVADPRYRYARPV